MADNNFFYYRGFPLVRSGNEMYYGSMGDEFVTKLTIKESEKFQDVEIPTKILVQLLPSDTTKIMEYMTKNKLRNGEMSNLYEALDTAYVWLSKELF